MESRHVRRPPFLPGTKVRLDIILWSGSTATSYWTCVHNCAVAVLRLHSILASSKEDPRRELKMTFCLGMAALVRRYHLPSNNWDKWIPEIRFPLMWLWLRANTQNLRYILRQNSPQVCCCDGQMLKLMQLNRNGGLPRKLKSEYELAFMLLRLTAMQ